MKKVLIVAPANLEVCPYVKKHLDLINTLDGFAVDLISWNRYPGKKDFDLSAYSCIDNSFIYSKDSNVSLGPLTKVRHFIGFAKFIIGTYNKHRYDKVIFLTSSTILFLPARFLKKIHYVFDYRDTSFEWFLPFFFMVKRAIKYADRILISSDGFRAVLPKRAEYINVHNIDSETFILSNCSPKTGAPTIPITVSFVGLFLERKRMLEAIRFFANDERFIFNIWGYSTNEGDESFLKGFISSQKIHNVHLLGPFSRATKPLIYEKTTLLLYYYSSEFRYRFATANKYYDGLFYGVPFLVNGRTTIGQEISERGLGLPIDLANPGEKDKAKIISFYSGMDWLEFLKTRERLMSQILLDDKRANQEMITFLSKECVK